MFQPCYNDVIGNTTNVAPQNGNIRKNLSLNNEKQTLSEIEVNSPKTPVLRAFHSARHYSNFFCRFSQELYSSAILKYNSTSTTVSPFHV